MDGHHKKYLALFAVQQNTAKSDEIDQYTDSIHR